MAQRVTPSLPISVKSLVAYKSSVLGSIHMDARPRNNISSTKALIPRCAGFRDQALESVARRTLGREGTQSVNVLAFAAVNHLL